MRSAMRSPMRPLVSALALAAVLTPLGATAEIGTVAAVNREMEGTPPIETTRLLVLGDTVYQDELVETSDSGSGQLMFVDQTTITIGPASSVVLDRFIYDPERQTGDIAASMAQGALRFIGGKITKFGSAEVRTPTATIAIRGGMVIIKVDCATAGRCETSVTNVAGSSVKVAVYGDADGDGLDDGPADGAAGQPISLIVLSRPGAQAVVSGGAATYTGLVTPAGLAALTASLDGSGTGGVGAPPSDDDIQSGVALISPVGSNAPESPYATPASTTGESDETGDSGETVQDTPDAFFDAGTVAELIGIPGEVVDDPQSGGGGPIDPPDGGPVDPPPGGGMIPDPGEIAALTGSAVYLGTATGVDFDSIENVVTPVSGSFAMSYDFGNRSGEVEIGIAGGLFSTGVNAPQGGENFFAGSADILGGPGTVGVIGNFIEGGGDPAAGVDGSFGIDLQERAISGEFQGTR